LSRLKLTIVDFRFSLASDAVSVISKIAISLSRGFSRWSSIPLLGLDIPKQGYYRLLAVPYCSEFLFERVYPISYLAGRLVVEDSSSRSEIRSFDDLYVAYCSSR